MRLFYHFSTVLELFHKNFFTPSAGAGAILLEVINKPMYLFYPYFFFFWSHVLTFWRDRSGVIVPAVVCLCLFRCVMFTLCFYFCYLRITKILVSLCHSLLFTVFIYFYLEAIEKCCIFAVVKTK